MPMWQMPIESPVSSSRNCEQSCQTSSYPVNELKVPLSVGVWQRRINAYDIMPFVRVPHTFNGGKTSSECPDLTNSLKRRQISHRTKSRFGPVLLSFPWY